MSFWYDAAPGGDVALSCRVRIARNLAGVPFPTTMHDAQAMESNHTVLQAFRRRPDSDAYRYLELRGLPENESTLLVERHLISPDILKNSETGAVLLRKDEAVSLMLNEEDHLRVQVFRSGLQLEDALGEAMEVTVGIEESLPMAYHEKLGYLTTCPTNVGTGVRASAMLHLPALRITGQLKALMDNTIKTGNAVRGLYGEGSEALGDMYQISNQRSLGLTESEIVEGVQGVCQSIITRECALREALQKERPLQMQDMLLRSFAVLRYARKMDRKEFLRRIGDLRLALWMGYVQGIDYAGINHLMLAGLDAALKKEDPARTQEDCDRLRAALARKITAGIETL